MTKISAEHLARSAYVYVRQSSPDQLVHNHESRRRQYGLAERAKQLGWSSVEIIGYLAEQSFDDGGELGPLSRP